MAQQNGCGSANQTSGSILILCTYIVKYSSKCMTSLNPALLQNGECSRGWFPAKLIKIRERTSKSLPFCIIFRNRDKLGKEKFFRAGNNLQVPRVREHNAFPDGCDATSSSSKRAAAAGNKVARERGRREGQACGARRQAEAAPILSPGRAS